MAPRTVSLGGVTLHSGLVWENQYKYPKRAMSIRRTLGGEVNVQSAEMIRGREINISTNDGNAEKAYLTRTQVEQLREFERLGETYTFVFGSHTISVIVLPGEIDFSPLGDPNVHSGTDVFVGSFKLLEV